MMKKPKTKWKLASVAALLCLLLVCFTATAYAADGTAALGGKSVDVTDMIVTVSATGSCTVTNAEGQTLSVKNGQISGDMPVHAVSYNQVTQDGVIHPEVSVAVPASDTFTYKADSQDLTVSFLSIGGYASFVGTGNGAVTFADNTLTVGGTVNDYKAFMSSQEEELNSLAVSASTAENLTVTSTESGVSVSGNSGGEHTVTAYYNTSKTNTVTYTSDDPVLISAVPGTTTGQVQIMADTNGDGVYDTSLPQGAPSLITSLLPYADPDSSAVLKEDPYDASSAGMLILRGAWADENIYTLQAMVNGRPAATGDVTWSVVDDYSNAYGFHSPCVSVKPNTGLITVLSSGIVKVKCTSTAESEKSFYVTLVVPGDYDRDDEITGEDADGAVYVFFRPDAISPKPYAKELLDLDGDGDATGEDADIMFNIYFGRYSIA